MSAIYGEGLAVMEIETPAGGGGNGRGLPPPKPIGVKTRTVYLDGDYEGFAAVIRTNAPFGLFLTLTQLQTAGEDNLAGVRAFGELLRLLPELVLEWNVCDQQGDAIPCDEHGFRQVPAELLMALLGKLGDNEPLPKGSSTPSGTT